MIDSDLSMGENESTPQAGPMQMDLTQRMVDDSDEPITAEWWQSVVGGPLNILDMFDGANGVWLVCGLKGDSTVLMNGRQINVKTRGDLRELCRLFGVKLK